MDRCIIGFASTELTCCEDPDVKLPWIHRVKCELPRRVGRLAGELPVRASYIGTEGGGKM